MRAKIRNDDGQEKEMRDVNLLFLFSVFFHLPSTSYELAFGRNFV